MGLVSNVYYTYAAACELTSFPKPVHTAFTIVGMCMCLDFFPAIGRLETELRNMTRAIQPIAKLKALSMAVSEGSSMCVDAIWFLDECKVLTGVSIRWAPMAYKILMPLKPLWLPASVYTTYCSCTKRQFTKECALDVANTVSNVVYYGALYASYFVKPNPVIPCIQIACCLSSLALSIL